MNPPPAPVPGKTIPRGWFLSLYRWLVEFWRNPVTGDGKTIMVQGRTISAIGSRGGGRGSSASFSGTAYKPNGTKVTGLKSDASKGWVKWSTSSYSFSEETGPAPEPWGNGDIWYEKANTYGNIVVTRLG